jgi:NAD(P)-dependent dehydrogenase (short-subunit alcohol dehydrogenase family)
MLIKQNYTYYEEQSGYHGKSQGKEALVTGGASSIGLSLSTLMAKEGAKVVIADFNEAGAKEAAKT